MNERHPLLFARSVADCVIDWVMPHYEKAVQDGHFDCRLIGVAAAVWEMYGPLDKVLSATYEEEALLSDVKSVFRENGGTDRSTKRQARVGLLAANLLVEEAVKRAIGKVEIKGLMTLHMALVELRNAHLMADVTLDAEALSRAVTEEFDGAFGLMNQGRNKDSEASPLTSAPV